ncbi:hypothetical protein G893_00543 [Escherichia coli KOEGE 71 (186a)]|uniref:restriction endonuclease subunit S n=1 Tax=Escherichia coli TaxID=562 RepID=UPI000391572E|nr:restriction endonuclease subunit S [Escherichia coli]EQV94181.1 hypothetical protein G893_00543 [Escherichia coli KOEGE 71 (186a)]
MAGLNKYQAYPEYRDSGVDWLGKIPNHWNCTELKRLCNLTTGLTPPTNDDENYSDDGYPWIRPEDINEASHEVIATKYVSNSGWKLLRYIDTNSTIICCIGTVGKCGYVKGIASTNQQITAATFKFSKKFNFYLIKAARAQLEMLSTGNVLKILNSERLGKLNVVKLEEKEADTIALFLDHEIAKIDNLIEKQQQLIELLKEKRQAVISHAVTKGLNPDVPMKDSGVEWLGEIPTHWRLSKLRYMFSFGKGLTITKENLQDEGIPCVNYGEIHSKYGFEVNPQVHALKCVDISYLKNNSSSLIQKGDIVFADTSEDTEGAGNFTQLIIEETIFAGYHTIITRPLNKECFRFYAYLLDSKELRAQIRNTVKGVKVFSVTQAILKGISIWFPSPEEQERIVVYLDSQTTKIDILIDKQLQQIELLKERRTALISAAVTGKIDLRNWTAPIPEAETLTEASA